MKKLLVLMISAISLTGCDLLGSLSNLTGNLFEKPKTDLTENNDNEQTQQDDQHQQQDDDHGQQQDDDDHGQQQDGDDHGQQTGEKDDHIPNNTPYTLENYETFKFYDDDGALLADDWNYYIKTTHKIAGELYNGNNGDPTGRGIIFEDRNAFVVSPMFNSWNKVEVEFKVWFSPKTGNKATYTEGEPQFRVSCYKSDGTFLGTQELILDNVPSTGTCASKKIYLYYPTMSYFIANYDNTTKKGGAIYCPVFHEITMKGWPYNS